MLVTILAIQAVDSTIRAFKVKDEEVRQGGLLGSIVDIGEPVVDPLIAALEDEDEDKEF